jgi:cytochrome c
MKRVALLVFVVAIALAFVVAYAQKEKEAEKMSPEDAMKASVMRGKDLFSDPSLGTNGKTCNDCHVAGGTKEGAMGKMVVKPFHEVNEKYPMYWMMAGKVMTMDQVINWCILTPLQGEPLKWDDPRLTDLASYCASVKSAEMEKMEDEGEKEDD